MSEIEAALETQGKYMSPVLLELGSLRRGSVHGRGVIFGGSAVEKRADGGMELGLSPRQAV